jgi:phosphate ABC transporter, permease protein PstC
MRSNKVYYYYFAGCIAVSSLLFLIIISLVIASIPAFDFYGVGLFASYFPAIYGTIVVSITAILIATVLSIGSSIFIVEYVPQRIKGFFINLNDLMASFPTIVYGFWGLYELGPFLNSTLFQFLYTYLGFIPLFSTPPTAVSYLLASIVLAIMITPFASSLIREVYSKIPESMDEGIYALGLGKYHVIKIKISYIAKSILGALTLAYGRGLGETVAVDLTIGNSFIASPSLLSTGITIPALIANQFGSAFTELELSSLFSLALVLFIIGLVFIIAGKLLFYKRQ